ncbi:MAG: hypothetical protein IJR61_00185, partial [Clostridia bacterium]|nr:hypothetical protein [Clostridia bacterium]
MTGANTSVIKFALVDKDLFLKAVLGDETNFDGKDRFGYEIKIGETSYSSQGHFENNNGAPVWETGGFDKVQSERYYDAPLKAYVMYVGIDLGSDYGAGNTVTVTFTHNDATTADAAWGSGEATTFSGTLYLVSKPAVEYTYVVPMIEGALTASDWDKAEVYEMTPVAETEGATGTVSLIVAGKTLYFKVNVNDSTQIVPDANTDGSTNDRPSYSLTIGGKTQYQRGKYAVNWMVGDKGLGEPTLYEDSKGDGTYSITAAYDLGDLAVKGAWLTVDFSHADAQTAENGWADSIASYPHAIRFAHKLYLGEVTEKDPLEKDIEPEPEVPVDPDPTEGPENADLEIVITDLVSMPTESDWNNAETYDLIKLHGNSEGATGTVKVYTAAQNIFYRMTVTDSTTNYKADGIYVYLAGYDDEGNEVIYYEARGNYDMWLADKERLLGSPSLLTMSTTAENASGYGEGVYTFSQGFYIPDIYAVGGKVHLILKHRDSRSNSEAWADSDYFHTIYFDQVMTFGDAADTTVRPQDATEGFIGSSANVSYNKADICWNEVADADTYKIWLYKVNPEGSDEPYEYIS